MSEFRRRRRVGRGKEEALSEEEGGGGCNGELTKLRSLYTEEISGAVGRGRGKGSRSQRTKVINEEDRATPELRSAKATSARAVSTDTKSGNSSTPRAIVEGW